MDKTRWVAVHINMFGGAVAAMVFGVVNLFGVEGVAEAAAATLVN